MSERKFRNKYRIASSRMQKWDYGWNASYFVTICTKNRKSYFGDIVNGEMKLSEIGKIVKCEWLITFEMRPDMNLQMGEYVVMPDHFHAIIDIGQNKYNTAQRTDELHVTTQCIDIEQAQCIDSEQTQCIDSEQTQCIASLSNKNNFGPQSKNLASIIRGFKIGVTKNARQINPNFAWQPRFHDHVIRNHNEYSRIKQYIINNPKKWNCNK